MAKKSNRVWVTVQAPVVQRVDKLYSLDKSLSSGANVLQLTLLASFPHNPILNLTYASTLSTNYRAIVKILHTFHLPDSDLSSG